MRAFKRPAMRGALCAAGLWMAATGAAWAAGGTAETTALRCGEWEVLVELAGDRARMKLSGDRWIKLRGVSNAAGTRYEPLGDDKTWYWARGEHGRLSWKGQEAVCRPSKHLGAKAAARAANEGK
ncbi:MAG: MliC family protein [Aquabacterium sp.]